MVYLGLQLVLQLSGHRYLVVANMGFLSSGALQSYLREPVLQFLNFIFIILSLVLVVLDLSLHLGVFNFQRLQLHYLFAAFYLQLRKLPGLVVEI